MTPPAKYMAIDTTSLDTTIIGIDDKLPGCPTADDVLPKRNPCSSDTRNDQTSTSHCGFLSKMENKVPSVPNSRSAANCETRVLSDKAVLEAKTASTPNLEDQLSTDPKDSVSNSHFPGTKSLLFTSQLLSNLLKYSIEPPLLNAVYRIIFRWTSQSLSNCCIVVEPNLD